MKKATYYNKSDKNISININKYMRTKNISFIFDLNAY